MGIVSQEPVLFATTIGDNIRLGAKHSADLQVTEADVERAAKEANCYDFISQLPEVLSVAVELIDYALIKLIGLRHAYNFWVI